MTPDTAKQKLAPALGDLNDVHRRLVRIHQALAEPIDAEVHKVRPWALGELMALIRDVDSRRKEANHPSA